MAGQGITYNSIVVLPLSLKFLKHPRHMQNIVINGVIDIILLENHYINKELNPFIRKYTTIFNLYYSF